MVENKKSRNRSLFAGLSASIATSENESPQAPAPTNRSAYLESRGNALAGLTTGDRQEKTLLWVEPERCRVWEHHNRRYDLLDEGRCADLIEGFKMQGKQEFPAIVRRVAGDPQYDFEVVCGARRHWTVKFLRSRNYTQFRFLIEVRDLTDEEAFRLSDIENRDRKDISDYERACDYLAALQRYYRSQKEMAERLEVSEPWLSRFLDLAALPTEIVAAYASVVDIKVRHGVELKKLINKHRRTKEIVEKATELKNRQEQRRDQNQSPISGIDVFKTLREIAVEKVPKPAGTHVVGVYNSPESGKRILSVQKKPKGGLVFNVLARSGATREELLGALQQALDEHYQS